MSFYAVGPNQQQGALVKMLNVLDCTPIAQFAIGLDHKITHWNRACELLTGLSADEMIGTDRQWMAFYPNQRPVLADLIVAGEFHRFLDIYQGKNACKSEIVPYAWQATDYFEDLGGVPRHIFFVAAPVVDPDGRCIGAVETLQDISKQVGAEQALRASEQRYRTLTETVADGILVLQERSVCFANSASARMLGCQNPDQLVGRRTRDFIHEDFREAFRTMSEGFEAGEFREKVVKLKCLTLDGQEIWIEAHNEFIQWEGRSALLSTLRDITEAKRQEMAIEAEAASLRRENRRLRYAARERYQFGRIIGKSHVMQEVYELILKASDHLLVGF